MLYKVDDWVRIDWDVLANAEHNLMQIVEVHKIGGGLFEYYRCMDPFRPDVIYEVAADEIIGLDTAPKMTLLDKEKLANARDAWRIRRDKNLKEMFKDDRRTY